MTEQNFLDAAIEELVGTGKVKVKVVERDSEGNPIAMVVARQGQSDLTIRVAGKSKGAVDSE